MSASEEPALTNRFEGDITATRDIFAGNQFQGNVYFITVIGHYFTSTRLQTLENFAIAAQSMDTETRLMFIEVTLGKHDHLTSTRQRVRRALQGFTDWKKNLTSFDGDLVQIVELHQKSSKTLEQIDKLVSSIEGLLQKPGVTSEDLRSDVVELDVAISELIDLSPRSSARNTRVQEVVDNAQAEQSNQGWKLPPLAPTDATIHSQPTSPEPIRATPYSLPPLPQAVPGGGDVWQGMVIDGHAVAHLGDFIDMSAISNNGPLPQVPGGRTFGPMHISGNARFHGGYTFGNSNTKHPNASFPAYASDVRAPPLANSMPAIPQMPVIPRPTPRPRHTASIWEEDMMTS